MTLILMVEDDPLIVEVARAALEPRGYIVGAVDDGLPVLSIVEFKRPDLVILDCGLPRLPGVEALRQIRASRECYATPVLMLTARRSSQDEQIAMHAGADDYLRKPFEPEQLISRVEDLLESHRPKTSAPSYAPIAPRGTSSHLRSF